MTGEGPQQEGLSESSDELPQLLAGQFESLSDIRPGAPQVTRKAHFLGFEFDWPFAPWEQVVAQSQGATTIHGFRLELLGAIVPSLAEVVELDTHRDVSSTACDLEGNRHRATVSFALGATTVDGRELEEGIRNWSEQTRRNARHQRSVHRHRIAELRRLREEMRRTRIERHDPTS